MKKINPFLPLLLILIFNTGLLNAQDSLLLEALKAHTYDLAIENERFSGKGARLIQDAIQSSQFLLVGEQHGIKEVAEFTAALFSEAVPEGYNTLCIETDPYLARKLETLAKEGEKALKEFLESFPLSIPFYAAKEEFQLLERVISLSNSRSENTIWGVDQVFMTMPRFLFQLLLEEAKSDQAKKLVSSYMNKAKKSFNQFIKEPNPQHLILTSLDENDFTKIQEAF